MELQVARQIIDCLAQGIHPVTGEAMPEDSPYNAPAVIRALHAVSRELDHQDSLKSLHPTARAVRQRPNNAGKPWTAQEDAALETAFDAGISLKQIAQELGRTQHAVSLRLVHIGKVVAPTKGGRL